MALAGCAALRPPAPGPDVLAGRMSVRVESPRPQSVASDFELGGSGDRGWLRLSGPLGATLAQARWSERGAVLVTPEGERRFDDLGALSREVLGEDLPLRALPDWLRGRPWPGGESRPLAPSTPSTPSTSSMPGVAAGGSRGFQQLGWTVDLAAFDAGTVVASRSEPSRVTLRARMIRE